jgi:hypothetical protein
MSMVDGGSDSLNCVIFIVILCVFLCSAFDGKSDALSLCVYAIYYMNIFSDRRKVVL